LNKVLFFSDNKELITLWSSILNDQYQTENIADISVEFSADIVLIDAEKIIENKKLLTLFNQKSIRFLVTGNNWPEDNQIEALVHGAAGYCNNTELIRLLVLAIRSVLKGDIWIQRHLVPKVIGALVQMKSAAVVSQKTVSTKTNSNALLLTLSNREREVANMICSGENNKSIASSLFISERTVKAHLTSIFKKLNVPDRLHLALFIKECS